jgi:hypothetical protein
MPHTSGPSSKTTNLIIAVIGLCLSLLMVEVAFRFLQPGKKAKKWGDRPVGYFLPSNAQSLQGDLVEPKQEGTFRISVVGDSFTFAPHMQYQDAFPEKLERFLNLNRGATSVEVVNLGVSGAATTTEVALVRKALDISSDLVILEITLNDAEPKRLSPAEKAELYDAPYLSAGIFKVWRSLGFVAKRLHNSTTVSRYIDYHTMYFKDPVTFKRFDESLAAMKTAAQRASTPLVAVVFPLFDFPFDDRYPFGESHQIINSALEKNGIKSLDLRPFYQNIPPERLQVIPVADNHPNEIAHRIAAERLLAFLATNNLVPGDAVPTRVYQARVALRDKAVKRERIFGRSLRSAITGAAEK